MFCHNCGAKIEEDVVFCPMCGAKVRDEKADPAYCQTFDAGDRQLEELEEPKVRVWPFVLIGIAVLVLAVAAVLYFSILKPRMTTNKTPTVEEQVVETEPATEEQTTQKETEPPQETTTEAATEAETFPKTMYTTAPSGLLLRKGPGKGYEAIYLLNYGRQIEVQRIEDHWAYTTVDGLSGWCSCQYLTENKADLQKQTSAAPAGAGKTNQLVEPINRVDYGYHGYVNTPENLNFRYGPGEEYDIIDVIPYLTDVEEEGWDGEWIYIQYKGRYGWVNSKYITPSGGMAKPAIYLYPLHTMDVSVKVRLTEGAFTRTAPESNGEWLVTAHPDGTLTDKATGLQYEYIYWESDSEPAYDWSKGFVIKGSDTEYFLHKVLVEMGLNAKESGDFVTYWLPRMQGNPYNLITFQTDCYTEEACLKIAPKPDSLLRVFMAYRALDRPVEVEPPAISSFERKGFTAVEWGGAEVR